jgi:hypothetical protein
MWMKVANDGPLAGHGVFKAANGEQSGRKAGLSVS